MKKNLYRLSFIFGLLAMFSCVEDPEDKGLDIAPEPNVPVVTAPVFSNPIADSEYMMSVVDAETDTVDAFSWRAANYLEEGEVTYTIEMDIEGGDFANPYKAGPVNETFREIKNSDFYAAFEMFEMNMLNTNVLDVRVVSDKAGSALISDTVSVTTWYMPSELYLTGTATSGGEELVNAIPFNQIEEGVFEVFETIEGEGTFSAIPTMESMAGVWGIDPEVIVEEVDFNKSGMIAQGGNAFAVDTTSTYRIKVDYNTFSFEVEKMNFPTELHLVGGSTPAGWEPTAAIAFTKLQPGVFEIYEDLTVVGDGFKFLPTNTGWDGDWGRNPNVEEETLENGDVQGVLEQEGEANLTVAEDGLYKIVVDFNTVSYTITKINVPLELYLVGGSTSADWEPTNAVPFTSTELGVFEVYEYITVDGFGFKFLPTNTGWDGDIGRDPVNEGKMISEEESNFEVTEDGFYKIVANFNDGTFSITKIDSFGIIGSATETATGDQWDTDFDMNGPAAKGEYTFTADMTLDAGEWKFRANDDWGINLGDNDADGSLEQDGSNIQATAGEYTITMTLHPTEGYTYSVVAK